MFFYQIFSTPWYNHAKQTGRYMRCEREWKCMPLTHRQWMKNNNLSCFFIVSATTCIEQNKHITRRKEKPRWKVQKDSTKKCRCNGYTFLELVFKYWKWKWAKSIIFHQMRKKTLRKWLHSAIFEQLVRLLTHTQWCGDELLLKFCNYETILFNTNK